MQSLFSKGQIGGIEISNKIGLAAMTRCRCDNDSGVPNQVMLNYYEQRAGAGFMLTECAPISEYSNAFPGAGKIYTQDHVQGWAKIVNAVHAKGSKIFLQIWHSGRATHSKLQGGKKPLAPSPIAIRSDNVMVQGPHEVPQELTTQQITEIVGQFKKSAELAKQAGFDGLEIHGANGYLIDQFLRDHSNKRHDQYGGSIENRCRFVLEVLDAVKTVYDIKQIGIKLSLVGRYNDMYDSNPQALLEYLLKQLSLKGLGFAELVNSDDPYNYENYGYPSSQSQLPNVYEIAKANFTGSIIANNSIKPEAANKAIEDKNYDLVTFAKLFISNPDLTKRLQKGYPLNSDIDWSSLYQGGPKGYSDYPNIVEAKRDILFQQYKLGDNPIHNKIGMAAMTRCRCQNDSGIPTALHAEYYSQRATAGFIISECVGFADNSNAFPGSAKIMNDQQAEGWKLVTDAVHRKGSKIFLQLYHSGRATHSSLQGGKKCIGPSPVAIKGNHTHLKVPNEIPLELTQSQIVDLVNQFKQAAQQGKNAGFDGVEIHAANGYLIEQFLKDGSNKRIDAYGGSIQHRCKFALDVVDAVISVFSAGKVGVKVTPTTQYNDMYDSNPLELYKYLFQQLDSRGIAFIELVKSSEPENYENYGHPASETQLPDLYKKLRPYFSGALIGNGGLNADLAAFQISDQEFDAATFGKPFITNPDFADRVQNNWETNDSINWATVFVGDKEGYTSYPSYQQVPAFDTPKEEPCCNMM